MNNRQKKSNIAFYDSRQKRSKKWPGRATAWEIRVTMGFPSTYNIDPTKYEGYVNARGDVTVTDKIKGRVIGQASSEEIDRVLMSQGARAGSLMTGERGTSGAGSLASGIEKIKNAFASSSNWVGSPASPKRQNEINRSNLSEIASNESIFNTAVRGLERVAKSIDGITQGTSDVINGLGKTKSVLKSILGLATIGRGLFKVLTKR